MTPIHLIAGIVFILMVWYCTNETKHQRKRKAKHLERFFMLDVVRHVKDGEVLQWDNKKGEYVIHTPTPEEIAKQQEYEYKKRSEDDTPLINPLK